MVLFIVLCLFVIRLYFLKISIANEKAIKAAGGREFGIKNSQFITLLHIMIYFFASLEAYLKMIKLDNQGIIGMVLITFSIFVLYKVTQLLSGIWTVKLMIVSNHNFVDHWLFRYIKHPNYFLNICPELIGLVLLCHAQITAMLLFPFYTIALTIRIIEENRLIDEVIKPNGYISK
ncbi:isoprenylcysteine carboxylmethyltransferase family protein [Streptococcus parauberis]|uniref:isoprenylcysteine carboxyl methyltransferase family protein n=1 Tax=Streptococcus parauberis TaxID=1348 RepID=UPI00020CBF30|nr:isoprenylcysteine carboxyl methyltransferase family protein [Streptococcus parauberis]AEF24704.1 isoprenylcysteine carboxyl methyltransferase (ICMT) family protein [Streptococcus parauberis KCTC 11537]UWM90256.1 isoprenylcysteine carboxyl methyltransferase family protein [Streptococcus parauberis]